MSRFPRHKVPAKCGIVVKTLLQGAIALQLVDPATMRVVARAVMTADERRTLGAALIDDAKWHGAALGGPQ